VSHSDVLGIYMQGPKRANDARVLANHISGGGWGIFVQGAHGGSLAANEVRDNCASMFFEAFKSQPVGGFALDGNTVADNTRSCRGQIFGRDFSGIGIALLGASGMRLTANHLWGDVPSGPTPVSGGVVVSQDPYFRGDEVRREAGKQAQLRHRQPLRPQRAGHLLGRLRLRQPLRRQFLRHERADPPVQLEELAMRLNLTASISARQHFRIFPMDRWLVAMRDLQRY
jgi:hypothetical protein